jgi:hypothetical protein
MLKCLDKVLDGTYNDNLYLIFWDDYGILKGGLWILFQEQTSKWITEVVPNKYLGDLVLLRDPGQLESIVGLAIPTKEEPEDMGAFITTFCNQLNDQRHVAPKQQKAIYNFLHGKMIDCSLQVVEGVIMAGERDRVLLKEKEDE